MKTLNTLALITLIAASIFTSTVKANVVGDAIESVNDAYFSNFDASKIAVIVGTWDSYLPDGRPEGVYNKEGQLVAINEVHRDESNLTIGISYKAVTVFTFKNAFTSRGYGAYYTFRLLGTGENDSMQLHLRAGVISAGTFAFRTTAPILSPVVSVKPFYQLASNGTTALKALSALSVEFGVQPIIKVNGGLGAISTMNLRYDF